MYPSHKILPLLLLSVLTGCAITAISPDLEEQHVPGQWSEPVEGQVENGWITELGDSELSQAVESAVQQNFLLAEQAARVEEARKAVIVSGAAKLPDVSLSFDPSRRQSILLFPGAGLQNSLVSPSSKVLNNNFQLGVNASWELDIWGKLSDAEKQANLNFIAQQARYNDTQYRLAANVARNWFNVLAAHELLELFEKRLETLKVDVDIIERAYRQGINSSLDVYLTRTTLEQERARIARQQQLVNDNIIALQLLLSEFPSGNMNITKKLPIIDTPIPTGLPSELLSRRPDLQQAWSNLLAADAGLAVAHKQRFPRVALTSSVNDVSLELDGLLDGSALAWSLLANLTQPIFNAGRLKALEGQARDRVVQAEKQYLDRLYLAFSEIQNAVKRQQSLKQQYTATLASEENAVAALALAFEQYQRGLVTYTIVLESQRRAFDAQSSVIDLRNQLIQNRIALHLALGGDYAASK